jgi:hypothetical protein
MDNNISIQTTPQDEVEVLEHHKREKIKRVEQYLFEPRPRKSIAWPVPISVRYRPDEKKTT